MKASVRELKDHLSKYLHRVQAGEDVTVTVRGRAVARLTEVGPAQADADPLIRLRRVPGIIWPEKSTQRRAVRRIRTDGISLSDAVIEERDETEQ